MDGENVLEIWYKIRKGWRQEGAEEAHEVVLFYVALYLEGVRERSKVLLSDKNVWPKRSETPCR